MKPKSSATLSKAKDNVSISDRRSPFSHCDDPDPVPLIPLGSRPKISLVNNYCMMIRSGRLKIREKKTKKDWLA